MESLPPRTVASSCPRSFPLWSRTAACPAGQRSYGEHCRSGGDGRRSLSRYCRCLLSALGHLAAPVMSHATLVATMGSFLSRHRSPPNHGVEGMAGAMSLLWCVGDHC